MAVKAAAPKAAAPRIRRISRLSLDERLERGRIARDRTPPSSHAGWRPAADRPDPVGLLEQQDRTREADLVPVRHGRMMVSPFTFYRGAAKIMAADLKDTPAAGLGVQLCGDAHLSNFSLFASPERRLVFDLNDFDETLPGPFEYDVKRMAASFVIAGRNNGFAKADARAAAMASVTAYQEAMADFARMSTMDIWYAHFDEDRFKTVIQDALLAGISTGVKKDKNAKAATLQPDRRELLEKFQIVDAARKVVGVGSVGARAFIVLLEGRDSHDPLFLQIKEATASVLEASLPRSRYRQHGERVVQGQRMMQAASDIFPGWTKGVDVRRHFYWRQLRDMKGSALVELMAPVTLRYYGQMCGWTLARAHARSGDPVAMAGYLGRDDAFGRSGIDFCKRYADQNEQDYEEFVKAVRSGRLEAVEGV